MMNSRKYSDSWSLTRKEYTQAPLNIEDVDQDPIEQLKSWLTQAFEAGIEESNAMVLATVDHQGQPDSRVVLLKELDQGLVFYTHYESKKGRDLNANPKACVNFYWASLERQIRIQGTVERVSRQQSIDYFQSRPKGSQIGAVVSPQSQSIESREWLRARHLRLETQNEETHCPETWGGYRLIPSELEFWQGCRNRLHDRICYQKTDDAWGIFRKAP